MEFRFGSIFSILKIGFRFGLFSFSFFAIFRSENVDSDSDLDIKFPNYYVILHYYILSVYIYYVKFIIHLAVPMYFIKISNLLYIQYIIN